MRLAPLRPLVLVLAALALGGCARAPRPAPWARVRDLTPAFLADLAATDPAVAADAGGHVALTYVTRDSSGGHDLWLALSRDSGATFSRPVRLNLAAGRVSSYAESRPLPVWGAGGRLAVAWSELRSDSALVADLVVRASSDAGVTLAAPAVVNDDSLGRPTFHGFPALAFVADGALVAAWMDGRTHPDSLAESLGALFRATSPDGGRRWGANAIVTDSLCPCCRAAMASLGDGRLALTWRSAARGVRDPVLAFSADSGRSFTPEVPIADDRWVLDACPSDGPVLAASREGGVSVWRTGAAPAGVYLAPWTFGRGPAGARRGLIDSLARAAHPRAVPLGAATLLAVEALPRGDSVSVIAARALEPDGTLTSWQFLGTHAHDAWLAPLGPHAALAVWVERERGAARLRLARIGRDGAPAVR